MRAAKWRLAVAVAGAFAVGAAVGVWAGDLDSVRYGGSVHLDSGTSDYEVNFFRQMEKVVFAPATADIVVRILPNHGETYESMTVRAGDILERTPDNLRGFQVDRTGATVVDVYWE